MHRSGGKLLKLSLNMWGSNGRNKAGIAMDLMVVIVLLVFLVVLLPLPLVPVLVIFGYRKQNGVHMIRVCCYR